MEETKRISWIDNCKALLIMLVVLGHLSIPYQLYLFICSFHMFGFFFVSGVLDKADGKTPFGAYVGRSVRSLYVPFLTFSILRWLFGRLLMASSALITHDMMSLLLTFRGSGNFFLTLLYGTDNAFGEYWGIAWFFVSLMCAKLFCYLLERVTQSRLVPVLVSAGCFGLAAYLSDWNALPFSFVPAMLCMPFYMIGKLYRETEIIKKERPFWWYLLCGVGACAICLICVRNMSDEVGVYRNHMPPETGLVILAALSGICMLVCASKLISKSGAKLCWLLEQIGRNTAIIYGTHMIIRDAALIVLNKILPDSLHLGWVKTLVALATIAVCSFPVTWFFNRFCPALIGKSKMKKGTNVLV